MQGSCHSGRVHFARQFPGLPVRAYGETTLHQFGTFSPSLYDIARVSMVYWKENDHIIWLFPECFEYILALQFENSYCSAYALTIDSILNTLAVLLALLIRRKLTEHKYPLSLWKAGNVSDEWNISSFYFSMLLSPAFFQLLQRYDSRDIIELSNTLVEGEIPVCLYQILSQTLSHQNKDDSFQSSLKETIYNVLIVSQLLYLTESWDTSYYTTWPEAVIISLHINTNSCNQQVMTTCG